MVHPDWVEAQKRKGYEIKKIGKGYYMYERKSRWDSNKKKAIKVTGEYIGVVTPDGVIPRKNKIDGIKPVFSLEYGATAFIKFIAGDILGMLSKHFDKKIAQKIWVISMLRLISPCPFRRVEDHYQTSWMSKMLPGLALSKSSISSLIDLVGNNRLACAAFMRDMMQPAPYLLIDGSRVTSKSEGILRALPGHNSDKKYMPQVNQIHIVTVSESGDSMPGFYRNVSGNTPDISAFELTLKDAGVEGGIILADNGFASSDNYDILDNPENKMQYIVPLKRNTTEVDLAAIKYEEYFTYHNRGVSAHVDNKGKYRICTFRDAFMYAKEFSDSVRRIEKANATAMTRKSFNSDRDLHDVSAKTKKVEENFGVIILRTNIFDKPASYVYQAYKIRWDIELLFKTLRNTCEQDASYMQDDAGFEAWTFFSHITMIVACRILAKLRELDLLKNWSLEGLLDHLSRIHVVTVANEWCIAETTKKTRELVSSLGYNLDLSQT